MAATTRQLNIVVQIATARVEDPREALKRRLADALQGTRLLRLATRCPLCSAPPKLRTSEAALEFWRRQDPDQFVQSVECHRRECSAAYPVYARDFQLAA